MPEQGKKYYAEKKRTEKRTPLGQKGKGKLISKLKNFLKDMSVSVE